MADSKIEIYDDRVVVTTGDMVTVAKRDWLNVCEQICTLHSVISGTRTQLADAVRFHTDEYQNRRELEKRCEKLERGLSDIAEFAAIYPDDQPKHILLRGLTVDIPRLAEFWSEK